MEFAAALKECKKEVERNSRENYLLLE